MDITGSRGVEDKKVDEKDDREVDNSLIRSHILNIPITHEPIIQTALRESLNTQHTLHTSKLPLNKA